MGAAKRRSLGNGIPREGLCRGIRHSFIEAGMENILLFFILYAVWKAVYGAVPAL